MISIVPDLTLCGGPCHPFKHTIIYRAWSGASVQAARKEKNKNKGRKDRGMNKLAKAMQ